MPEVVSAYGQHKADEIDFDRSRFMQAYALANRYINAQDFGEVDIAIEAPFVREAHKISLELNEPKLFRNMVFSVVPLTRGRGTENLYDSLADTEKLREYIWLFKPEVVARTPMAKVKKACSELFSSGGFSDNDFIFWKHNAKVLTQKYQGDIGVFFEKYNYDGPQIADALIVDPVAKRDKKEFWGYGPKTAYLALHWLRIYDVVSFKNAEYIDPPADLQLMRILVELKIVSKKDNSPFDVRWLSYKARCEISEMSLEHRIDVYDMFYKLWLVGHYLCTKNLHEGCPLREKCFGKMNSDLYYEKKKIDPEDLLPLT